MHTAGKVD